MSDFDAVFTDVHPVAPRACISPRPTARWRTAILSSCRCRMAAWFPRCHLHP